MNIMRSEFTENHSDQSGAVMTVVDDAIVHVSESRFIANTGLFDIFTLISSHMSITNSVFFNNFAEITVNGFYLYNSSLTASGIQVTQSL